MAGSSSTRRRCGWRGRRSTRTASPSVDVAGTTVVPAGGRYLADVPVADGANPILVRATDVAGNVREASVTVVGFACRT